MHAFDTSSRNGQSSGVSISTAEALYLWCRVARNSFTDIGTNTEVIHQFVMQL